MASEENIDAILIASARECYMEHGASVTTSIIAERAGITREALFERFQTKADLLIHALGYESVMPWLPKFEGGPDDRCIKVQLLELAQFLTDFYVDTLPSAMAIWSAGPSYTPFNTEDEDTDPREVTLAARARLTLSAWMERAQNSGRLRSFDAQAMAIAFLGACQAPALRRHLGEDFVDIEHYTNSFIDLLWAGIKG